MLVTIDIHADGGSAGLGRDAIRAIATLTVRWMPEAVMRGSVGGVTCLIGIVTFARIF
jgi:hypothetical protein